MSQQQRVGKVATAVFTDRDGLTKVVYHQTPVVAFDANRIILDHGGWRTTTTKTRMNQAANQFGLGYRVFQKDRQWFVDFRGRTLPFAADNKWEGRRA